MRRRRRLCLVSAAPSIPLPPTTLPGRDGCSGIHYSLPGRVVEAPLDGVAVRLLCRRFVRVGRLSRDVRAGLNRIAIRRLRGTALSAGPYRPVITVEDAAANRSVPAAACV